MVSLCKASLHSSKNSRNSLRSLSNRAFRSAGESTADGDPVDEDEDAEPDSSTAAIGLASREPAMLSDSVSNSDGADSAAAIPAPLPPGVK